MPLNVRAPIMPAWNSWGVETAIFEAGDRNHRQLEIDIKGRGEDFEPAELEMRIESGGFLQARACL
jgi:hypothetical protein